MIKFNKFIMDGFRIPHTDPVKKNTLCIYVILFWLVDDSKYLICLTYYNNI